MREVLRVEEFDTDSGRVGTGVIATSPGDLAVGTAVLCRTILDLDQVFDERARAAAKELFTALTGEDPDGVPLLKDKPTEDEVALGVERKLLLEVGAAGVGTRDAAEAWIDAHADQIGVRHEISEGTWAMIKLSALPEDKRRQCRNELVERILETGPVVCPGSPGPAS